MSKTVSDGEIIKVSQFLGIDPDVIRNKSPEFSSSIEHCKCGHKLDFFDFVKTAFNHGVHEKKYMADFFSTTESMNREMTTPIACSVCDAITNTKVMYKYSGPHTCS
ncbi:hypothetical protein EIB96_13905 [Vibrio parahaemolyticus]|uniref:hypothetical protein n=1 Tax=Vibrio parahaemolyticus TaxID=670 RepID=UPI0004F2E200|nr:hypothetical protein [Vibrio parahaemolyticus]RFD44805.1 hypothetical protein H328_000700 [Vibrio parahaemolyticus 3355]EGR0923720.1 hypothetical protein [Vibrio parahaemolyticus]EGR1949037.1 hypothetical protein [Vibrio parahaemolyticus]EIN9986986.1 hypothetical protein [Vibrio parahaemolyticus]EJU8948842.1 hypothetical protein [Vibrio parahaemolyticus]